ncbi:Regulatory protein RecX [compost metagenome]
MEQRYGDRGYRSHTNRNKESDHSEIVDISEESFWVQEKKSKNTYGSYAKKSGENRYDLEENDNDSNGNDENNGVGLFPDDIDLEITSVQMLKRPKFRYRISFGPYSLEVHEDVMIKYRMLKGTVFSKIELTEIVLADERQRGYGDALQYLSRKPRTGFEISMRLKEKGWSEETIAYVMDRLTGEGLVNDALYAQEWAGQRVKNRGKGKLWVRQELRQKGVSKPLIEEALGEVSEEDEYDSAMQLGAKKWKTTSGEYLDKKRKVGSFLMRRGFSGGLVSRVLRELASKDGADGVEDWEEE